ncbi:hypothetical protein [Thermoactinomyces sp. DSM 45892]|uniref:hypothetical protein n=1 Tax=Thermoactinomyces sp. DSM 45892 TaxID=1882753 RepID=UPI00089C486F|nr:hypothetical protein [Thermoactinomyces sp. DSM 45892]SDZ33861.1 hypothetical protein SAMN05444416_1232 [Thermoactinomyces sp. DSM 45892]
MKRINKIDIKEVWSLEENVERLATEIASYYSPFFKEKSFNLHVMLERTDDNPKYFPTPPKLSKDKCLEPHYNSCLSVYLTDKEDNVVGWDDGLGGWVDEEYDFTLSIWSVERSFFFLVVDTPLLGTTKRYMTELSMEEIKQEVESHLFFLAKQLGITLDI